LDFVGAVAAAFTTLDEGADPISIVDAAEARPRWTAVLTPQLLGIHYEVLELAFRVYVILTMCTMTLNRLR